MVKKASLKLKEKFYVTTPIYYPNDIPHIGHAYTTIAADILARWNKLLGKKVFFLTGTDEHGKKLQQTAEKAGKTPKDFVDGLIPEFKSAWKKLNLNYNFFVRTTDANHEKVVQEMLQKSFDNGDIYLGEYEGLYCTGCEAYYTEKDLEEGCCPIHKKPVENLKEKSYFFKLSKYQKKLLDFYEKNQNFLLPKERANQIISQLKEGLQDLSISRTSFDWGIRLPFDKDHICYVWFDALFNYYSALVENKIENFWPADVHLIGKDILWFHAVYWPAFLMSVGLDLPKQIFAHGWWTFNKEKISKSRGKVINVDELIAIAGVDSARYFLFREAVFGQDGDFSEKALIERHNNELANKLGNLVSRVSALAEKYGLEKCDIEVHTKNIVEDVITHTEKYELDKALSSIFAFVDTLNQLVQDKKPWETGSKKDLYELVTGIRLVTILLSPFMPETCEKISKVFNFKIDYKEIDKPLKISKIEKAPILFTKIEIGEKSSEEKLNKLSNPKKIEGVAIMADMIKYDDFAKLDLRVGTIKNVEDLGGADKLWKLTVDLGKEIGTRTILAGIKKYYSREELLEKQIIVIVNLEPRKMKGSESQGMLLAAGRAGSDTCILISPEKKAENGTQIG